MGDEGLEPPQENTGKQAFSESGGAPGGAVAAPGGDLLRLLAGMNAAQLAALQTMAAAFGQQPSET